MNEFEPDRAEDDFEDDDERMLVPAGRVRVVLGLMMMTGGVLVAALAERAWVKEAGLVIFLLSLLLMLKRPKEFR